MKCQTAITIAEYNQNILLPAVKRVVYLWQCGQLNNMRFASAMSSLSQALAKSPLELIEPGIYKATVEKVVRMPYGIDVTYDVEGTTVTDHMRHLD